MLAVTGPLRTQETIYIKGDPSEFLGTVGLEEPYSDFMAHRPLLSLRSLSLLDLDTGYSGADKILTPFQSSEGTQKPAALEGLLRHC